MFNPDSFDGHRGHGGVALFSCVKFNDFITPIQNNSDRIVGIKLFPSKENTFHLLSVYLSASSHPIVDLWAVCNTCFQDGTVFLLGDFNAELGDSVGSRGTYPVTARENYCSNSSTILICLL